MVRGYTRFSGVSLTGNYTEPTDGGDVTGGGLIADLSVMAINKIVTSAIHVQALGISVYMATTVTQMSVWMLNTASN